MFVFDASSMIYAWDNYPNQQFPAMWEWMKSEIEANDFFMPEIAFKETIDKFPELGEWLNSVEISKIEETAEILAEAFNIQQSLGIRDDAYGHGVGENDILIIATAKIQEMVLITNEARQTNLPQDMKRYKIPAVCSLENVNVVNMDFLELIKSTKQVFR